MLLLMKYLFICFIDNYYILYYRLNVGLLSIVPIYIGYYIFLSYWQLKQWLFGLFRRVVMMMTTLFLML